MRSPIASEARPTVASTEAVIRLERIGVKYVVPRERIYSFKEYAIRALQQRVQHEIFWALREVNLDIQAGETVGVIGRNGAGKTTLLKVISRVLRPTEGRVRVRGRVAPLLELGAGFHHELTGRENVYLNGALLGYSHADVERLFDDIVGFAEIGDFIDAPLRTYSTGMATRLGFAVATAIQPAILLVDEVLSVGDAGFQKKCAARMEEFRRQGTTTILITHSVESMYDLCDRAVWLDAGAIRAIGQPEAIAAEYLEEVTG